MHLWGVLPVIGAQSNIRKMEDGGRAHEMASLVMQWPKRSTHPGSQAETPLVPESPVTILCFHPPLSFIERLDETVSTCEVWEDAVKDPFAVLCVYFECWWETVNRCCWEAIDKGWLTEKVRDISRILGPSVTNSENYYRMYSNRPEISTINKLMEMIARPSSMHSKRTKLPRL